MVIFFVFVNRHRFEDDYDDEYEDNKSVLKIGMWLLDYSDKDSQLQEVRGQQLFFFEQRIFNGLHPLWRVGDLEGSGVFLAGIV